MDDGILLNELQTLANTMPDFALYRASSNVHNRWLAKVIHYVKLWNNAKGKAIEGIGGWVGYEVFRESQLANVSTLLHEAIVDLESRVTKRGDKVFRSGEVYDLFKEIRNLVGQCASDLLIVDPWTDVNVFDAYFSALKSGVRGRLLTFNFKPDAKIALERFNLQRGDKVEVHVTANRRDVHDRAIFSDAASCYVCGQSLNHAAEKSPTYLMPLAGDAFELKRAVYEDIWNNATPI